MTCKSGDSIQIIFSFGYTGHIDYLSRNVAIAHQDVEFQITRQRALEIEQANMALRRITIKDGLNDHNCDYNSNSKITRNTETSMYGSRQYSCDLNAIDYIYHGTFNYEDHAGRATVSAYASTYDFDGSKYEMRILPAINSASTYKAFRGGGGKLRIEGHSFVPNKTKFYIDGTECPIIEEPQDLKNKKEMVAYCQMPELPVKPKRDFYIGNHGWHQSAFFGIPDIDRIKGQPKGQNPNQRIMILNSESSFRNSIFLNKKAVTNWRAFFEVPQTAKYRFWMTSSRDSRLYMDVTRPNEIIPASELPEFMRVSKPTKFRNLYDLYQADGTFLVSDWQVMMKDDYYHMEIWHNHGQEDEHLTMGIEI